MVARKKLIALNIGENSDIREEIEGKEIPQSKKDAMLKDCHLVEAALGTDRRIVSLDDTARILFAGLSDNVADMRDILWVDPDQNEKQQVIAWLECGQGDPKWKLGHKD